AALYTERLVKRSSLEQMWTPFKLNDGKISDYGFGWGIANKPSHRAVAHGGGIPGFTTDIRRLYDDKVTIIVLTNMDGHNPGAMGAKIAGMFVPAVAVADEKPVSDTDVK